MAPDPDDAPSRLDLACEPSSIRNARRHTQDVLERWAVPTEVLDDALLIVSELATNAVRHTVPPSPPAVQGGGQPNRQRYSLALWTTDSRLYIAVLDQNPAPPMLREAPAYAETGRGLWLVSTLTAGRWGYERTPEGPGKQVWAALELPAPVATTCPQPVDPPGSDAKATCRTPHQPRPHAGVVST
ncbi:ATP-binding protein [Streptomyces sp. IBSBF 2435]|uniref:ATP-binding protein n=1 Tax=Streptomyces sp. IBSBF 2435 TaxID=2903531 RepID=UPI002FDC1312